MKVSNALKLENYSSRLAFIQEVQSKARLSEKWKVVQDNLDPFVKTSGDIFYPPDHPSGLKHVTYQYSMGLVTQLDKPQILLFFTPELEPMAYAVMDFQQDQEHKDLFNREFPKFRAQDSFGYHNHFLFCMWRHPEWQTYPLKVYDHEKQITFDGEYFHGHHPNGNGLRELRSNKGWSSNIELNHFVVDHELEKAIRQLQESGPRLRNSHLQITNKK